MRRITLISTLLASLLVSAAGCNAYRLDPPAGFAQVHAGEHGAHMKANDDVGLRINVFGNVKGGTLAFWSRDLVEKLGRRDYQLTGQSAVQSKNGVVGTRFDFSYTPVGKDEAPRFYTAVLFVTDQHRVVLQLAGKQEHQARYRGQLDGIVADLKVRGCKVASKICKGPQPDSLSSPAASAGEAEEAGSGSEAAPTKDAADEPEPTPTTAMLESVEPFEPALLDLAVQPME